MKKLAHITKKTISILLALYVAMMSTRFPVSILLGILTGVCMYNGLRTQNKKDKAVLIFAAVMMMGFAFPNIMTGLKFFGLVAVIALAVIVYKPSVVENFRK